MRTKRSHEGYLLIDHRNSPGVSREYIAACGLESPAVGAGQTYESATITCSHCQGMVVINPLRTRDRGYCSKCDRYVCDLCEGIRVQTGICLPMVQVLDNLQ